ncbi:hypothetical protein MMC25_006903 [Agyrium rufum]|nr:hypothetical protein [Agyrium rufum]
MSAAAFPPSRQQVASSNGSGPAVVPKPVIPPGTFIPGTKVQVGGHRVVIEKYLSEGGFAHVYLVRLPKPIDGEDGAVLKRVAVPDKENLVSMRTEVETMKKLKGHRHIVKYIDSHASQLKGGGYEVFLLMEYCAGGGLIDFMNTRLQNRLTEPEILKIFSDAAQGVATMHYLKPPLLHRDLKVENILISSSTTTTSRQYKLCDFGSTAPPRPAATTAAEGRLIEDDVQKHTTLQYRSPEMIDVYRKQPIDEKSDIWALGVLLYKLCYYTTPFEEQGQMAILNASFKFPSYPAFSSKIKLLIASMLRENPSQRPNIYEVVKNVCLLRGTDIPIQDIYTGRTASEARRNQSLPNPHQDITSSPVTGAAYIAPPATEKQSLPDITPMRRGRPTNPTQTRVAARPSPSPLRHVTNDPFAALDTAPSSSKPDAVLLDDAMSRFPAIDQFSILSEPSGKFTFDKDKRSTIATSQPLEKNISQRVTEALADDAFASAGAPKLYASPHSESVPPIEEAPPLPPRFDSSVNPSRTAIERATKTAASKMVSAGTMTSPEPSTTPSSSSLPFNRPIYRFPASGDKPGSQTSLSSSLPKSVPLAANVENTSSLRPNLLNLRSRSQVNTLASAKGSLSSRPSMEGVRPQNSGPRESMIRSKSGGPKPRPLSAYVEPTSRFGRAIGSAVGRTSGEMQRSSYFDEGPLMIADTGNQDDGAEATKIDSNVDFLKAMEEDDQSKRKIGRSASSSTKHSKRSSMPSISLSGTKQLLAGRFGEAFRKFESNTGETSPSAEDKGRDLTPIDGSEATDGRSDDGGVLEETEDISPEVRREIERRRLSQEERRVVAGAAAYKQRMAEKGSQAARNTRAASIQNKVQSLLDESGRSSPVKSAEGYGKYTNSTAPVPAHNHLMTNPPPRMSSLPNAALRNAPPGNIAVNNTAQGTYTANLPTRTPRQMPQSAAPNFSAPPPSTVDKASTFTAARPSAPPKPKALQTGGGPGPAMVELRRGVGGAAPPTVDVTQATPIDPEEWEANFTKKYPQLSALKMVETEVDAPPASTSASASSKPVTIREV